MAADARAVFASCFASLLEDSGLQAKQVVARIKADRQQRVSWSVTAGLLSAWKTGRNLPSEANQDGFFRVVRLLTEHARGRAVRGHAVGRLLDEVAWARLLKDARTAPLPDASHEAEIALYLKVLIGWLNTDPWPRWFGGSALTPAAIERKLRIVRDDGGGQELDADELAGRCSRLVVLGDPGTGKTWLARRVTRLCAEAALERLVAGDPLDKVELPLYTTCARLAATPVGDDIRQAIVSSALGQIPDLGGRRAVAVMQELFEERGARTLLVLDSLDEASGADDRIRQADTLPESWRIILTSRQASWNGQVTVADNHPSQLVGVLQPLCYPEDVELVVARWFSMRPTRAAGLITELRARPALQQAATVPLISAFYCIIGGYEPLPARRADVYAKVIRRMLTSRWRTLVDQDLDLDACLEILCAWAWSTTGSSPVSGVGAWADEFSAARVGHSPAERYALGHVAVPLGPPDADTGKIPRRFIHRSLQEYLVAEHVVRRMTAEEAAGELLNHLWYDPDWEFAAPAALARHPEAHQVLKELVWLLTGSGQFPPDLAAIDSCWEIRRFLTRVALESDEDDWPPETAELIGRARVDLTISRQDDMGLVVASHWPTSNRLIIQWLLGLLENEVNSGPACDLAKTVARLDPAESQLARARELLLAMVAGDIYGWDIPELAKTAAELHPAEWELSRIREALLAWMTSEIEPRLASELAGALAGLDPPQQDRGRAREALLAMLAEETHPKAAQRLTEAVSRLAVSPEDRTRTRQAFLELLTSTPFPSVAVVLAQAVAGLAPAEPDWARAREALLALLASQTDPWKARDLARAIAGLDPSAMSQMMQTLLAMLAGEADSLRALTLIDSVLELDPAAQNRARTLEVLLTLLSCEPHPVTASLLGKAVSHLAATAEERAPAREALLALLATKPSRGLASSLGEAVVCLTITAREQAQARDVLFGMLTPDTAPQTALDLANTIASLNPASQDLAPVREVLLTLLASTTDSQTAADLAGSIASLNPATQDLAQAREALFTLLASKKELSAAWSLGTAITQLATTSRDRTRAQAVFVGLLSAKTDPWAAVELASLSTKLDPAAPERSRAIEALLTLLAGKTSATVALAKQVVELAVSPEDKAHARRVLVALFSGKVEKAHHADAQITPELARIVAKLDPATEDLAQTRAALLTLLASETDPRKTMEVAGVVAELDPAAEDLTRVWEALLALLLCAPDSMVSRHGIVEALAALPVPLDDRTRLRTKLLQALADEADHSMATALSRLIAEMHPTIAEISGAGRWSCPPTPTLLAAVRKNSELAAWLAMLPVIAWPARTAN